MFEFSMRVVIVAFLEHNDKHSPSQELKQQEENLLVQKQKKLNCESGHED
jgi:hypothetical protein